jgi:hypothetical protein
MVLPALFYLFSLTLHFFGATFEFNLFLIKVMGGDNVEGKRIRSMFFFIANGYLPARLCLGKVR